MLTLVLFSDNLKDQVLMKRITIQDMAKMHLKPSLEILSFYHSKAIRDFLLGVNPFNFEAVELIN